MGVKPQTGRFESAVTLGAEYAFPTTLWRAAASTLGKITFSVSEAIGVIPIMPFQAGFVGELDYYHWDFKFGFHLIAGLG